LISDSVIDSNGVKMTETHRPVNTPGLSTRLLHQGGLITTSHVESALWAEKYGLRPVLRIEARSRGDLDLLLSRDGIPLGLQVTDLVSGATGNPRLVSNRFALAYDLGAAVHHCCNLAKTYATIVTQYLQIRSIPGLHESESDIAYFGYQTEPYYELDALLSASRRAYDKIGQCVWQAFERGGEMPGNVSSMLRRLSMCPAPLKERLQRSWLTFGAKLKDYRDCTQHFASIDLGMGSVAMKRLEGGLWIAWARIPDNPKANSKRKFTYAAGHDALTYGWEIVNEVAALATEIVAVALSTASKEPAVEAEKREEK